MEVWKEKAYVELKELIRTATMIWIPPTNYWAEIACNNLVIKEEHVITWPHTIDNI